MIKAISEELTLKKREDLTRELGEYLGDEAANVFLAFANEPSGCQQEYREMADPKRCSYKH